MRALDMLVTGLTIAANSAIVIADLRRSESVISNATSVGVPLQAIRFLAGLKGAGVVGLGLGLLGAEWIGVAAASGLVLFYFGAVAAHVRARVLHNIAFPGTFLALACGSLAAALTR